MTNVILYCVVTQPGGIDGLDPSSKGGLKFASLDEAEAKSQLTPWDKLEMRAVDIEEVVRKALHPIDPVIKMAIRELPELVKNTLEVKKKRK